MSIEDGTPEDDPTIDPSTGRRWDYNEIDQASLRTIAGWYREYLGRENVAESELRSHMRGNALKIKEEEFQKTYAPKYYDEADQALLKTIAGWYRKYFGRENVAESELRSHMRGHALAITEEEFQKTYKPEWKPTQTPPGTGYNLERLKAAWLAWTGAKTPAALQEFLDANNKNGGFATGVTRTGSKLNQLAYNGQFVAKVIGSTDNNPYLIWDTNSSAGPAAAPAASSQSTSTAETAAQRAARMASFGLGPGGLQNQPPGEMPAQPTLGDMTGPQGPFENPGMYTPGAAYQAPEFRAPDPYQQAPQFSRPEYQAAMPFTAPTAADMGQDPGYQFRLSEGQRALERSGAARGVTNTGGNMRGILDYGQQAASQEYGNVYNRNLSAYNTNEANRAGAYQTNYGNALNAYNTNEANRAGAYGTNAANAFQQYSTNALAQNTYNAETEARRSGAFSTNTNLYQQAQTDAYNRTQRAYEDSMARYQSAINNQRQYERDRMNDIQFAAGA